MDRSWLSIPTILLCIPSLSKASSFSFAKSTEFSKSEINQVSAFSQSIAKKLPLEDLYYYGDDISSSIKLSLKERKWRDLCSRTVFGLAGRATALESLRWFSESRISKEEKELCINAPKLNYGNV